MTPNDVLELLVRRDRGAIELLSPGVGLFTESAAAGSVLSSGADAGALIVLGRASRLRVPHDVEGRVRTIERERVQAPVGYGDVLYALEPLAASTTSSSELAPKPRAAASSALVLRAPQSGRFYHRAAPGEPAFVAAGQLVSDGQPIGIVEVMKTFTHVVYRATASLPPRAKVVRVVAGDGAEVRAGDALVELEPS